MQTTFPLSLVSGRIPASFSRRLFFSLLALYWLVILHIPWANNGGYGMDLPMNMMTWATIAFTALAIWLCFNGSQIRITTMFMLMFGGAVLFTLPALWTPHDGLIIGIPRLAGIWGGVLTYLALLQQPLREKETIAIFYLLAAAAVIQTIVSLVGLYYPSILPFPLDALAAKYHGNAPGIFQQINVTASFLATGLAALLFLLADRQCALHNARRETARLLIVGGAAIAISATLVLLQTRIGWIGGLAALLCSSILVSQKRFRRRTTARRRVMLVLLPTLGCVLGVILLNQSLLGSLEHEGSTHQRLLTLIFTLQMIVVHPWQGWGLGMFESAFQNFMADLPFANPSHEMMQHPHNETLFVMAEGGIIALAGGLCMMWGWITLWRRRKNLWQWAALLTTLPVLLHTQVEFPLYYSVGHFFALLLLLSATEGKLYTLRFSPAVVRPVMIAASLYGVVLSLQLFNTSIALGKFETAMLTQPDVIAPAHVPWLLQPRYQHDLSLQHLAKFNHSGNMADLDYYLQQNAEWIKLHMEEPAYNNQIHILAFLHREEEAQALKARAHRLMPWDDRFAK